MTKFTIPLKYFIFLQLSHRRCLSQHKVKSGMACWHKIKCDMVGWYGIIEAILTSTTDISLAAVVFGDWNDDERLKSSTWRESETVRRVINSNIEILKSKKIKVYSDNKNVQSVLQIGS